MGDLPKRMEEEWRKRHKKSAEAGPRTVVLWIPVKDGHIEIVLYLDPYQHSCATSPGWHFGEGSKQRNNMNDIHAEHLEGSFCRSKGR